MDGGVLFHSRWFAFLVPPEKMKVPLSTDPVGEAESWRSKTWPSDEGFKKSQPMVRKVVDDKGVEETLVKFVTTDVNIVAHMRGQVFDWVQAHFDSPEFWVRGVDQIIAIREDGNLLGGVGPARVK